MIPTRITLLASLVVLAGCSSAEPAAGTAAATTPPTAVVTPSADLDRIACHSVSEVSGSDFLAELDPTKSGPAAADALRAKNLQIIAGGRAVADAIEVVQAADDPRGDPNIELSRAWLDLADACGDLYGDGPW